MPKPGGAADGPADDADPPTAGDAAFGLQAARAKASGAGTGGTGHQQRSHRDFCCFQQAFLLQVHLLHLSVCWCCPRCLRGKPQNSTSAVLPHLSTLGHPVHLQVSTTAIEFAIRTSSRLNKWVQAPTQQLYKTWAKMATVMIMERSCSFGLGLMAGGWWLVVDG